MGGSRISHLGGGGGAEGPQQVQGSALVEGPGGLPQAQEISAFTGCF